MKDSHERHRHRHRARKERVLHTRVSDALADDIRRIAEDLRVPASNLVRNVLEEVFDVVESMSDDVGHLVEDVLDEADDVRESLREARRRARRRHRGWRSRRRRTRSREDAGWAAADEAEYVEPEPADAGPAGSTATDGPPPPPIDWFFVEDGLCVGPYGPAALRQAAREGRLTRESLAWCAGMTDWDRAGDIPGLAPLLVPPPPPKPPEPPTPPAAPTGESESTPL